VGGALEGNTTVGQVLTTTDGGDEWESEPLPATTGMIGAVSCPSATLCIAVGQTLSGAALAMRSTDGGVEWAEQTLPPGTQALRALSCPTLQHCVSAGSPGGGGPDIVTTDDAGSTWQAGPLLPLGEGGPSAIDCPSATVCLMVGSTDEGDANPAGAALISDDGGYSWITATLPPGTPYLTGIACTPAGACIAVGGGIEPRGGPGTGAILTTSDDGASWTVRTVPSGMGAVTTLSCPTGAICVAVGTDPDATVPWVATTTDGGAFWSGHPA